jgi:TonB-dependent starch-binding outer membrane protein SusC
MTKFYLSLSRYLTVLLVFVSTMAWSQSRTVTGKVTSAEDGSGLPGVNIVEKGTSNGTTTDVDGGFSLNVGSNSTLVFSFVGYQSQEVPVGNQTSISINLNPDVTQLSEVVVIGYGETTVKDATGAVAAVRSEDFNGGVIASPEQLIQGKTAGVQITSVSGNPGDGVQLRIRGTTSIRSNNNPLFVVDGVPLSGGTQSASADVGFGTTGDPNPLNFLNPNDIESVSILKDASATAIYGSRGANGVVIITTKKGRGAGVFELSSNVSLSTPRKTYDLLNRDEFLNAVQQFGGDRVAQDKGGNTDWQDYVLRNSISHKQNLAYSRGFKTGQVRASFGYDDLQGILENSYMKRLTGNVNVNKSFLDDKLNFDLATTFSNVKREDPPISGNAGFQGDILGAAYSANPTWTTDPDFDAGGQRSPANMLTYYSSTGFTNRALINLSADYKLTNSLVAKATYGVDMSKGERITLISGKARNAGNGVLNNGQGQLNHNSNINHLLELTLNYTKKTGNVDINVVGGYSVQSFGNKWDWITGKGFTDPNSFGRMEDELRNSFDAADAAASAAAGGSMINNWGVANLLTSSDPSLPDDGGFVNGINFGGEGSLEQRFFARPGGVTLGAITGNFYDQTDYLQSYFGRANFTISEKYLITATLRADGSSRFGDNYKYGLFPSGAVAWQIHEEDFLPETFNTLKLRVGYGITGSQEGLGYGQYRRRTRWSDAGIGDNPQIGIPGSSAQGFANPDLKWESTAATSIGVDFGFLGDRLTGAFDWYNKQTEDLLLQYVVAQPALASTIFQNLPSGVVENKGWELSLNYEAIDNSDVGFSIGGNVSNNKNMLKGFGGAIESGQIYGQGLSGAFAQRLSGGYPLFSYYLREFEGFDANGQPIGDNQTFVGKSALPTWNAGLSLNARYMKFDLAMYFNGQFGHYIYNNTRNGFFTAGSINNARNVTKDVLTSGESGAAEAAVSTRFLEKGDFVRMQNLVLGYNAIKGGSGAIKGLRISFTAQNLFVITDYSGLDPEISTSPASYQLLNNLPTAGIDYAAYPRPRTFTIGLNATF